MRKAGTIFDSLDYEFIAQMSNLGTWYWRGQDPGVRHERRQAPLWMAMNRAAGKCWCGRPKSKWEKLQRRYCRSEHGRWWHFYIEAYWASFRWTIIERDDFTCAGCGFQAEKPKSYYSDMSVGLAVDHILAISLGGKCYDESNVQTLCAGCHAKKTASDAAKLADKKRLGRTIGTGHQSRTLEAWT